MPRVALQTNGVADTIRQSGVPTYQTTYYVLLVDGAANGNDDDAINMIIATRMHRRRRRRRHPPAWLLPFQVWNLMTEF